MRRLKSKLRCCCCFSLLWLEMKKRGRKNVTFCDGFTSQTVHACMHTYIHSCSLYKMNWMVKRKATRAAAAAGWISSCLSVGGREGTYFCSIRTNPYILAVIAQPAGPPPLRFTQIALYMLLRWEKKSHADLFFPRVEKYLQTNCASKEPCLLFAWVLPILLLFRNVSTCCN